MSAPSRERRDRRDEPRHAVGEPRGGPRRGPVAKGVRRAGRRVGRGPTQSAPPTVSRTSSPSGSRAARSPRASSTATRTCRSPDGVRTSSRRFVGACTASPRRGGGSRSGAGSVGPPREGGIYRSARMLAEASDDEVLAFCRRSCRRWPSTGRRHWSSRPATARSRPSSDRLASPGSSPRRRRRRARSRCRVSRRAEDGARRLGPRRLRRADPRGGARASRGRGRCLRGGHRVLVDDLVEVAHCASDLGLPDSLPRRPARALGAAEAVALAARSADHLNHVSATGIAALGGAPATVAVLLPTSTLFLFVAGRPSPARRRRGGRYRHRLQPRHLAGALDARGDRDRLFSLRAPTARGARGRDEECIRSARSAPERGTLSPGRPADLVVLDGDAFRTGAVPAGPQPGGPDVRRRREGWGR